MSRYELVPLADHPDAGPVVVGWDRPLQTFYVQVRARGDADSDPDEEGLLVWRGTMPGELPTAAEAVALASRYAAIPAKLSETLEIDRLGTLATTDGMAQRLAKAWLFGSAD